MTPGSWSPGGSRIWWCSTATRSPVPRPRSGPPRWCPPGSPAYPSSPGEPGRSGRPQNVNDPARRTGPRFAHSAGDPSTDRVPLVDRRLLRPGAGEGAYFQLVVAVLAAGVLAGQGADDATDEADGD